MFLTFAQLSRLIPRRIPQVRRASPESSAVDLDGWMGWMEGSRYVRGWRVTDGFSNLARSLADFIVC